MKINSSENKDLAVLCEHIPVRANAGAREMVQSLRALAVLPEDRFDSQITAV